MKKLHISFFTLALLVVFVSCKSKSEEIKKLPSKIIYYYFGDDSTLIWDLNEFFYDEQNRLIKVTKKGQGYYWVDEDLHFTGTNCYPDDTLSIIYNSDGLPVKLVIGLYDYEIAYFDNGKKIVILDDDTTYFNRDTLWLNDKGQVVKSYDNIGHLWEHTYNSKGNIKEQRLLGQWVDEYGQYHDYEIKHKITYSRIHPIFRHVNTPEWILFWLSELWLNNSPYFHPFEKNGYLPIKKIWFDPDGEWKSLKFIYELNTDNYVIKTKVQEIWKGFPDDISEENWEYEYILAK